MKCWRLVSLRAVPPPWPAPNWMRGRSPGYESYPVAMPSRSARESPRSLNTAVAISQNNRRVRRPPEQRTFTAGGCSPAGAFGTTATLNCFPSDIQRNLNPGSLSRLLYHSGCLFVVMQQSALVNGSGSQQPSALPANLICLPTRDVPCYMLRHNRETSLCLKRHKLRPILTRGDDRRSSLSVRSSYTSERRRVREGVVELI